MRILWYPKKWRQILDNPELIYQTTNRMRAYNFHEIIKREPGVQSEIMGHTLKEARPEDFDVVVFQKEIHSRALGMQICTSPRAISVWDIADPIGAPVARSSHRLANLVIASNHELAEDVVSKGARAPVETVVDNHDANPAWIKQHTKSTGLLMTWYGIGVNYFRFIKSMREQIDLDFLEFRWACGENTEWNDEWGFTEGVEMEMDWREAWASESSWQRFIFDSDIGIVPVANDIKSPHKILNYMAYGIPVVCSPSDSHRRLITHGENGFFASTSLEWQTCLEKLKDPSLRSRIGARARETALVDYGVEATARKYHQLLKAHLELKRQGERSMSKKLSHFACRSVSGFLRTNS